ncbi:MAG: hypothetical protein AMXMBFR84_27810 [Candidatus Hydrogenedentota bacterium]
MIKRKGVTHEAQPLWISWLRVVRTQRTFAFGWHVSPVYRNSLVRNVIYAVTPAGEPEETEPINPVALALFFRKMLDQGTIRDRARLAQQLGLTRARVTQLLNLLKLPPAVITELSAVKDSAAIAFFTERRLRSMTKLASAQEQLEAFQTMRKQFVALSDSQ